VARSKREQKREQFLKDFRPRGASRAAPVVEHTPDYSKMSDEQLKEEI
jgi:hypothetical protein